MSEKPPDRNAQRSSVTRATLVRAARGLFAERGYAAVGTEEIVRGAGVTRGALYHQFSGGKPALFAAVVEEIEQELMEEIATGALSGSEPYGALEAGIDAWLEACLRPEVQQIALLDAPSVLGWEAWREIGMRYGLGLVQGALQAAMDTGALERQPVRALAHVLVGALDEAGLMVARAEDPEATRAEMSAMLRRVLAGLRPQAGV
jgi:AcrR family transcriptional regulator